MKEGFNVRIINAPHHYFYLFNDIPKTLNIIKELLPHKHFIHYFTKDAQQLKNELPSLKAEIVPNGMIWISRPKQASKNTYRHYRRRHPVSSPRSQWPRRCKSLCYRRIPSWSQN